MKADLFSRLVSIYSELFSSANLNLSMLSKTILEESE